MLQIEDSPERLSRNFPLRAGVLASPGPALRALSAAIERGAGTGFLAAAASRNTALGALRAQEMAATRERAAKRWDAEPISIPRFMADLEAGAARRTPSSWTSRSPRASTWAAPCPSSSPATTSARAAGASARPCRARSASSSPTPARPVVAVSGDGSAMYSIQALWTAAHHDLAVVFVILDNREYRILKHNMDAYRQRFGVASERPYIHMDLAKPDLSFVDIAHGLGVPASRVTKPGDLTPALAAALACGGPYLLDVAVEGRR